MKKQTAMVWANSIDITERKFNEYLVELGYQTADDGKWFLTQTGRHYSEKFCGRILWDIDAVAEVLKLHGKKSGEYFYCEKCGKYNRVLKEDKYSYLCRDCGFPALEMKQEVMAQEPGALWWNHIKECVKETGSITETPFKTWIEPLQYRVLENRIFVEAPYEEVAIQYVRNKYRELFKEVIKKETGKSYIISFVQPGEILIEDE